MYWNYFVNFSVKADDFSENAIKVVVLVWRNSTEKGKKIILRQETFIIQNVIQLLDNEKKIYIYISKIIRKKISVSSIGCETISNASGTL